MTKTEYFAMARRLWRGFESVTRVRAMVIGAFVALVLILSTDAAASQGALEPAAGFADVRE